MKTIKKFISNHLEITLVVLCIVLALEILVSHVFIPMHHKKMSCVEAQEIFNTASSRFDSAFDQSILLGENPFTKEDVLSYEVEKRAAMGELQKACNRTTE